MTDNRRKIIVRKIAEVSSEHLEILVRLAELVALTKQLVQAIENAGEDGVLDGHWWSTLDEDRTSC